MSTNVFDIPQQCRGTLKIGATDYHYARSIRTGSLMLVLGKDPRDWAAIDAGALDYSVVAQQEHDVPGFAGHDGPRIGQACPICNGLDGAATKDPNVARARLAGPDVAALPVEDQVEHATDQAEAEGDVARFDQAEFDRRVQAAVQDKLDKAAATAVPYVDPATQPQVTGAADPKDNAGIPPTDPDVVAGAAPEVKAKVPRVTRPVSPVTGA